MSAYLLKNMDIIGYLGVLDGKKTMPKELQRVFKHRELDDAYMFPPYAVSKGCIYHPLKIRHKHVDFGSITQLRKEIPAKKNYHLWCDDEGNVKHGDREDMLNDMESVSRKHVAIAARQFRDKKFLRCLHHCEVVRSANSSNLDSLVLKAACQKMLKDQGYSTTVQVGCSYVSKSTFLLLVVRKIQSLVK